MCGCVCRIRLQGVYLILVDRYSLSRRCLLNQPTMTPINVLWFFNMELIDSDKFVVICLQRFPLIKALYQKKNWITDQAIQLHLLIRTDIPKMSPVHFLRVCITCKYSINLLRYEI